MARTGDWIQTYTGRQFYPLDPRADEIDIRDIAHALAQTTRFCGHLSEPYSVAQHSVCVAYLVPPHLGLRGLLHDGSEAYMNDISRPLKRSGIFGAYLEAEAALQVAVYEAFDATQDDPDGYVKLADEMMLRVEAERWFPHAPTWASSFPALAVPSWYGRHGMANPLAMSCWPARAAEHFFLRAFEDLRNEQVGAG